MTNPFNWYWGENAGRSASAVPGHLTVPVYVDHCTACPSQAGPGQPGIPDPAGFVANADGENGS